jgi:hypothetical protein
MKGNSIIVSALFVWVFASSIAFASPITYDISFSGTGILPTGSFTYDPANPTNGFTVSDNGDVLDFTSSANDPTPSSSAICGAPGSAISFAIMNHGCTPGGSYTWSAGQAGTIVEFQFFYFYSILQGAGIGVAVTGDIGTNGSGTYTIEPQSTATPEPVSFPLFSASLAAAAIVARRRFVQRFRQTA